MSDTSRGRVYAGAMPGQLALTAINVSRAAGTARGADPLQ